VGVVGVEGRLEEPNGDEADTQHGGSGAARAAGNATTTTRTVYVILSAYHTSSLSFPSALSTDEGRGQKKNKSHGIWLPRQPLPDPA
jgi:hypothetical protein